MSDETPRSEETVKINIRSSKPDTCNIKCIDDLIEQIKEVFFLEK